MKEKMDADEAFSTHRFTVKNKHPKLYDAKLNRFVPHTFCGVEKAPFEEGDKPGEEWWFALFKSDVTGDVRIWGYC